MLCTYIFLLSSFWFNASCIASTALPLVWMFIAVVQLFCAAMPVQRSGAASSSTAVTLPAQCDADRDCIICGSSVSCWPASTELATVNQCLRKLPCGNMVHDTCLKKTKKPCSSSGRLTNTLGFVYCPDCQRSVTEDDAEVVYLMDIEEDCELYDSEDCDDPKEPDDEGRIASSL